MKKSRCTDCGVLKESKAGIDTADLCRKHGILQQSFYCSKAKYGSVEVSDGRRLRQLDEENRNLK